MEANEDKCFVDLSTMLVIIGIAQTQNNNCKKIIRCHPFSMQANFSEKLTFLTL